MATETLTLELLGELEKRWRDQGAQIVSALRPGLSDGEMDAMTADAGIRLPAEARILWGWHDGAVEMPGTGEMEEDLSPEFDFLSLAGAVRRSQMWRRVTEDAEEEIWRDGWLALNSGEQAVVLDCGGQSDQPVPVYAFLPEGAEEYATPTVDSIGELVRLWIEVIDAGGWSYDRKAQRWQANAAVLDRYVNVSGLV